MPETQQCPNGNNPCHLNAPHCNISPGLLIVKRDGKQIDVCGDCTKPGDEIIGQARSLGFSPNEKP